MDPLFAVLNPGGRDATQLFPAGAGEPSAPGHAPINYHAYAACCRSGFHQHAAEVPGDTRAVLVLLRKNDLKAALRAVLELKARRIAAFVSWKESGLHQVSAALDDPARWRLFQEICAAAGNFLSSTPELTSLYRSAGCIRGEFLPTPYPVDVAEWDFSIPPSERSGIFIGTREFEVSSRNHLLAVAIASRMPAKVTVFNPDGRRGEKCLRAIAPDLQIIAGRLPYIEYLRLMAQHRVVFQLDRSAVPGQVAGDALLCRLPCVGGDGAVDRLAFPSLTGYGRSTEELTARLSEILESDSHCESQIAESQDHARRTLSFETMRERIKRAIEP